MSYGPFTANPYCLPLQANRVGVIYPPPESKFASGPIMRICTAVLYDDLLRQVRVWARLGHSPTEIQDELDSRFRRVATVLEAMAVSRKAKGTVGNGGPE